MTSPSVVEAEVAVDEDRAENLEDMGRVVPGELAEERAARGRRRPDLAGVVGVVRRHLAVDVDALVGAGRVAGRALVRRRSAQRRVVVEEVGRQAGTRVRAEVLRARHRVRPPVVEVDLGHREGGVGARRCGRDRARVHVVGRGARRVRHAGVVGARAADVRLENRRAGGADPVRVVVIRDRDRDVVERCGGARGRDVLRREAKAEVCRVQVGGGPGRAPEIG